MPAANPPRAVESLHDGWTVKALRGPVPDSLLPKDIPATVPGSIHTDLMAQHLIPDPFIDANERLLAWIGLCDWQYSTRFQWQANNHDRTELVFAGLDTVAVIHLNTVELGRTANMHRTYRFDVRPHLREGENELTVTFESPVSAADRASLEQGYRPHVFHHPFNSIRKMASNFGWDWGIDAATVGIWRPVYLDSWSGARIAAARPVTTIFGSTGQVDVHIDIEWSNPVSSGDSTGRGAPSSAGVLREVRVDAIIGGEHQVITVPRGCRQAVVRLEVPDVDVWWPRGYGGQPLYDLSVIMTAADADVAVDRWDSRIGFRTIRIETDPDEFGTPFTVVVNERPIFIKGANWIPDDAFVHRVDRRRYAERIDQAIEANINLLRVWGGGVFESDDFFDLCDERGMLTWQDFLFACAAYPEEEPMRSEVEAEARDNITRLMTHPSLALWNGSNENLWGYEDWSWKPRLDGKSWGEYYYRDLLPEIVAELDPGRSYIPSSPYSPDREHHPNDPSHGSTHAWKQWNSLGYETYRQESSRFVAEFGWQGPPTWSTLTSSISDAPLTPESPGMVVHQKALDGNIKLIDGLVKHLPLPDDMDDWHWAMSLNQAVAVQTAIEHFRSNAPRCMGTVVWQLNDDWPAISWSAIDHEGRAKPLLFALTHAYRDRLITVQPRAVGLAAVFHNDSAAPWDGDVRFRRLNFAGDEIAYAETEIAIDARGTLTIAIPDAVSAPGDSRAELLVVEQGSERALWFFADYRDSALDAPRAGVTVELSEGGYLVTVSAENLIRDLALLVDKLAGDARVDDQLVTLLPGEQVTFLVSTTAELFLEDFRSDRVLRSANQLVVSE